MHFDPSVKQSNRALCAAVLALHCMLAPAGNALGSEEQSRLPEVQVKVGTHLVKAELADNDLTRQVGLMNRRKLGADSGMLFVFDQSHTQCMWMKNTLIDLDVAFADDEGRILNIEQMKAGTTQIHCSKGDAKTALEMNRNWFADRNIGQGAPMLLFKTPSPAKKP
jgi:uncharacterized protein